VIGIISESRSPSPRNADWHRSEYAVDEDMVEQAVKGIAEYAQNQADLAAAQTTE
jgi:hypothetical protein